MDDQHVMHAMSVDDAYRIEHTLSEGPTGTTELVTLNGSGPFLRKRIPSDAARRAVWAVLADCDCPFLPRVWATYELPDEFVVVYDYVAGTTLKDHISSNGALAPREAVGLAENVCAAAKALHDHGVIHRDISPSNVIVSHDGAHLIDLGIASTRFACENHEEEHYGTWGFAAPEQYGFAQTDARSDVYSIGRLLGYMLTGVLPDDETYEQRLHDPDAVPPALLGVVACACAFEPSSRYQTAEELAQAARSALEQQDVREEAPAAPPEHDDAPQAEQRSQDSPAPVRRSRGKIALAAGALGVAGLLAALILLHGEPAGPTGKDTQPEPTASSSEDVEPSDSADSPDSPDTDVSPDTDTSPDAGASSDTDDSRESSTGPGAETASAEPDPTEPAPAVESDGDAPGSENDTPVSADEDTSGLLAAASRNDADVSPVAANSGDDAADSILQMVDAWWDYQSGTVRFILGVTNTSADTVIKVPQVRVTGKASDGSIVFSQTASFFSIYPGNTAYCTLSESCNEAPDHVEFSVVKPGEQYLTPADGDCPDISFSNLSDSSNGQRTTVTGEFTAKNLPDGRSTVPVFVTSVLRDDEGEIVGGATTMIAIVSEEEIVPFEVTVYDVPDYASFELYAQIW